MGYIYDANKAKPWRKPRWRIAFSDPSGKLVDEKGTSTEAGSTALLAMREKDVAKGCWSPLAAATGTGGMPSVTEYAARHNARRVASRKALAVDGTEWGRMKNHVLPRIGKMRMDRVERDDVERVIAELMQTPADKALAPKTILAIYGDLRVMFKWAHVKDKVIPANPCTLTLSMDELPQNRDKDPRWRETAKYARKELVMLLTDPRLPPDRHMVYGLEFLGAMRAGEAAGRRWVDFDEMEEPLEKLLIVTQYDDQETKTRRPRGMPVHPALADMLREFRDVWWPVLYGRKPRPDDFIVPIRGRGRARAEDARPCRNANTMYLQLQRDLELLGLRRRRAHDLRRTLISMAQAGHCSREALKACTHGSKGDIISDYTTWNWSDLCAAILCVQFELPTRPAPSLRLASHTTDSTRQRGSRSGESRHRYGDAGSADSLTPRSKASVGGLKSSINPGVYAVTPTGIETEGDPHKPLESATFSATSRSGLLRKTGRFSVLQDEPLTPGTSELDLRDALLEGAAALLEDRVEGFHARARLSTILHLAAGRLEALAETLAAAVSESEVG